MLATSAWSALVTKFSIHTIQHVPFARKENTIMKKLLISVIAIGLGVAVLNLLSGQLLAQENASQLFLAPSAVPEAIYTPIVLSTPGSITFNASQVPGGTVINDVAVLPTLLPNPSNPVDGSYTAAELAAIDSTNYSTYFALSPTVDYSASTPGGVSNTVTFNQPGMYFVQLQTDVSNGLFEVDVDVELLDGVATGPNRQIVTPPNDGTTIISSVLVVTPILLPKAGVASGTNQIATEVSAEYAALGNKKFELTLVGHGTNGSITIGTDKIDISNAEAFQKSIDQWVSSIHFVSCNTGLGALGAAFLSAIQTSIPYADAWNDFVEVTPSNATVGAQAKLVACSSNVPPIQIASITVSSNNVRITWTPYGGMTNVVQVTKGGPGGSYSNNFTNLSPMIFVGGTGPFTTNYVDVGGATNRPARYYRVWLLP
jgi:hypothetical protein